MRPLILLAVGAILLSSRSGAAEEARTERGLVPFAGGDTDIGFGLGFLGSLARLEEGHTPFRWRLEGAAFITAKSEDGLTSPYQDAFLLLTVPSLLGGRGRLELRPSFTREANLRYYGIGNASAAPEDHVPERDLYQRTHPTLVVRGRYALGGNFLALGGVDYTHNWIAYAPISNVARDLRSPDDDVRAILDVDRRHGLVRVEAGIAFETRDDEIETQRGQFHQARVRQSLGGAGALPYRYTQLNLTLRFFTSPWPGRVVLAFRQITDLQLGTPPFYELSRFEEASAFGGANGVRGIPGDRYHGKVKVFGNLEARVSLAQLAWWGGPYTVGITTFVDGGRLWADLADNARLDGTGLGLKYGLGAGLRVRKGRTFVVRADLAWSPDARPLGAYLLAGHMF